MILYALLAEPSAQPAAPLPAIAALKAVCSAELVCVVLVAKFAMNVKRQSAGIVWEFLAGAGHVKSALKKRTMKTNNGGIEKPA